MKETLSAKQIDAIKALIKYPTVKEAAEASGNPIRTLQRWLTQPEFLDALHQVQKDSFKAAGHRLINSTIEAAEAIVEIMRNPTQPGANMKLKAATAILELGDKYHKSLEQDVRLNRLEEKAGIEDQARIAKIEDYFNRKIVEDYMHSEEFDPIAPMSQVQIELFESMIRRDPSKINLLTPIERVKYDEHYRKKLRLIELEKQQMEIYKKKIDEKYEECNKNKTEHIVQLNLVTPSHTYRLTGKSKKTLPDDQTSKSSSEPQSIASGQDQSILTDEDFKESGLDRINRRMKEHDENYEQGNLDEAEDNNQYWEPEEDD